MANRPSCPWLRVSFRGVEVGRLRATESLRYPLARDGDGIDTMNTDELLARLRQVEVSTLCDGDKDLPVVDSAIRALVPDVRMAGVARTVIAEDDHLPVFTALAMAGPGDVLVIDTNGGRRAILGELIATEAARRGVAGLVIDGCCRDLRGAPEAPPAGVRARHRFRASGSVVARPPTDATVDCGGIEVSPGDIVFGDDDGIVIAPAERIAVALAVRRGARPRRGGGAGADPAGRVAAAT